MGLGDLLVYESLCGHVDEILAEDLADERERPGGAEVALNYLELRLPAGRIIGLDDLMWGLGVVGRAKEINRIRRDWGIYLHVEGASNLPGLGHLLGNVFYAIHDVLLEVNGRQH